MPRYYVHTLGCKLNQFDTARAEGVLRGRAYVPVADPALADVIVLNTCTVTGRADAEGRRLARMFRRLAPDARIVATGCYAERDPEALRRTGAFDSVVGLSERAQLPQALFGAPDECVTAPVGVFFADRARAYLRVQEGCDLRCSYCIIPSVRGPGRSFAADDVVAEARTLADAGVREIGLTGVNTGSWGADLVPRRTLADLLEDLLDAVRDVRVRLNSLEPRTVTPRLIDMIAAAPDRLVPHVQIPLQSGSDRTLARMARNYRTAFYRDVVEDAVARVPDLCVGADVIAGFPGETDADHAATLAFVSALPLGYLHVFSYSVRPGTRAAALTGAVPPETIRARTNALRSAGARLGRAFRERMLGSVADTLVLDATAPDGSRRALTGNYIEVLLDPAAAAPGERVPVRLATLEKDGRTVRGAVVR